MNKYDYSFLGLGDISKVEVQSPFKKNPSETPAMEMMEVLQNPKYLWFTCKYILNIDLLPLQVAVLQEMWDHKMPMLVASRGFGKSFLLAVYGMLKTILNYKEQVVIVGAGFRQSKVVFGYMENIWNNAPVLQSIAGPNGGPRKSVDQFVMQIGDNKCIALPLGDGQKIRGTRATTIIADEFACLRGNTIVETAQGLKRIKDCGVKYDIINKRGELETPEDFIVTPPTEVYEVTTELGNKFYCSAKHLVMTQSGWKLGKDLTEDDSLPVVNHYTFPTTELEIMGISINEEFIDGADWSKLKKVPDFILESPRNVVVRFLNKIVGKSFTSMSREFLSDLQVLLLKVDVCSEIRGNTINVVKQKKYISVINVKKQEEEEVLYDFYLPQTHSFFGNGFIQHNSIPLDIFETVVVPFGAVSSNPVENHKKAMKRKAMIADGVWNEVLEEDFQQMSGNQILISGTADFGFKHFSNYWNKYKSYIETRGTEQTESGNTKFNYKNYCVIRIPFELIPEKMMDEDTVANSKATIDNSLYMLEYGAVFVKDSEGFFKRSLIEGCVTSENEPINGIWFDVRHRGDPEYQYVMGVDPASERDNFAITMIELHPDHNRVVYVWHTNRNDFKERQRLGISEETDYYGFCARKIRDLIEKFPNTVAIGIDSGGGGISVEEALQDKNKLHEGELPLYPIIEEGRYKKTDDLQGDHILHMVNFGNYQWLSSANYGLRKDLTDKFLLFPQYNTVLMAIAAEEDRDAIRRGDSKRMFDSVEDCMLEIEELKNELTSVKLTTSGGGERERWDVPEVKDPSGKKGKMKKDRYSALLIANSLARTIQRTPVANNRTFIGGTIGGLARQNVNGGFYNNAPYWLQENTGLYAAVKKGGVKQERRRG